MKNIFTTALIPMLAALAFGCSSSSGLQSSESDDLYFSSSDRTVREETILASTQAIESGSAANPEAFNSNAGTSNGGVAPGDADNPEYYAGSGATATGGMVTNNYNYYGNSSRYYSGRSRVRFSSYNYYGYDPFYDPFYSPFGYSAAYCYGVYDPFWYPYCYPSGFSISLNFGYGYGYPYGGYYGGYYGYRPYYYGYPYGGYYSGYYDGYYGGAYGYRNRVYGKRTDRSVVPVNGSNASGGRNVIPGRQATNPRDPGRVGNADQPVVGTPANQNVRPVRGNVQPETNPNQIGGRNQVAPARPVRNNPESDVRPGNYQFQEQPATEGRPVMENARPVRSRDMDMPASRPDAQPETAPVKPAQRDRGLFQQRSQPEQQVQPERPVQRERGLFQQRPEQPVQQSRPSQPERPSRQEYSHPQRNIDFNGGRQGSSPGSFPGGNMSRPGR